MAHIWAAFYALLAICAEKYCRTRPDWTVMILGAPRWTYLHVLISDFIALPLLLAFSIFSTSSSFNTFLFGQRDVPSERFVANVFYSIMGCMLKDVYLQKDQVLDLNGIGLFVHHLFAISATAAATCVPMGGGMIALSAVNAEVGSGFYNVYILLKSARSLVSYIFMMTATSILAMIGLYAVCCETKKVVQDAPTFGFPETTLAVSILLVCIRQYAVCMTLVDECKLLRTNPDKALLSKTFPMSLLMRLI